MQALILAAGFGTRLKPYSLIKPKPLFPVLNLPLLYHTIEQLLNYGFTEIIVNGHYLKDQIQTALHKYPQVTFQPEEIILGTGGGIRLALNNLNNSNPLLIVNGDIVHDLDMGELYRQHRKEKSVVTMFMHNYPRFNTVKVRKGLVDSFGHNNSTNLLAFTGVQVVNPEIKDKIPANEFFHIIDLYKKLAKQGAIRASRVENCFWRDMGTVQDYLELHQELLTTNKKLPLIPRGKQNQYWLIGNNVQIEPGVKLEGWGCIGDNSYIGKNSNLKNVVLWENSHIKEDASCEGIITH